MSNRRVTGIRGKKFTPANISQPVCNTSLHFFVASPAIVCVNSPCAPVTSHPDTEHNYHLPQAHNSAINHCLQWSVSQKCLIYPSIYSKGPMKPSRTCGQLHVHEPPGWQSIRPMIEFILGTISRSSCSINKETANPILLCLSATQAGKHGCKRVAYESRSHTHEREKWILTKTLPTTSVPRFGSCASLLPYRHPSLLKSQPWAGVRPWKRRHRHDIFTGGPET